MSVIDSSLLFRPTLIVVEASIWWTLDTVIEDMFKLENDTGAIVTCNLNGVELSTNYCYSPELLKEYYLFKLKENK